MTKTKSLLFWLLALIITISSAVYQRMTGPTYPLSGKVQLGENQIPYKFERSHSIISDSKVSIAIKDSSVTAHLFWRRYKFDTNYDSIKMSGKDTLVAFLPKQPPAGKLEYFVKIEKDGDIINIPEQNDVVIRFKGDVPSWILIPHVLAMFLSMLFASRAAFEYFSQTPRLKFFTYWTIVILFVGGFILGPIMQYYAFGAFWTGFPFGYDLTDNKTLIAMIGWLIALFMLKRSAKPIKWILAAALIMFIVYLIPHSVLGSEHDYSKTEQTKQQILK